MNTTNFAITKLVSLVFYMQFLNTCFIRCHQTDNSANKQRSCQTLARQTTYSKRQAKNVSRFLQVSWECPQTLPALFIGPFQHVERFRNLKFAVNKTTDIKSTVLSSSKGIAAIHIAFK